MPTVFNKKKKECVASSQVLMQNSVSYAVVRIIQHIFSEQSSKCHVNRDSVKQEVSSFSVRQPRKVLHYLFMAKLPRWLPHHVKPESHIGCRVNFNQLKGHESSGPKGYYVLLQIRSLCLVKYLLIKRIRNGIVQLPTCGQPKQQCDNLEMLHN